MKTNQRYLLLSLVTMLTVSGASIGALSLAQTATTTATTTLTCSVAGASVTADQAAIITASGGNGTYFWSGPNLNVTNSAGSQFAVSYPTIGAYPITVTSAGQTATCNVNVVAAAATSGLNCFPVVQNVVLGQTATVSATGGNGTFAWSSPDLAIANPNGSGFSASYSSIGLKTLTVTSGGLVTACVVNVLANSVTPAPAPVTPGLPSTGGGFAQ